MMTRPVRVLCVDDNEMLAAAVEAQVGAQPDMEWAGWVANSPMLVEQIRDAAPDVVLMDIDMPGPDPFESVARLTTEAPQIRVLMFSAYVRLDYIDRAITEGAWGYVSKNESTQEVMRSIRRVCAGDFVLTAEILAEQRALH